MRLVPALVSIPAAGLAVLAMLASAQAPAEAQTARPRPGAPAPVPAAVPAPAAAPVAAPPPAATDAAPPGPQQTTATFEDWTLRCTRLPAAAPAAPGAFGQQFCELVQTVSSGDKPVAQIAIGRPTKGQPLLMTVLTPVSVSFTRAASLITQKDGDASTLDLGWHRCIPGGCLADAPITDDLMRRIQVWTEPARIVYADAAGRPVALPFSARGLPTALGALTKAEAE